MSATRCTCSCGNATFEVRGAPLFRVFCHCTICQRYNGAPFADVVVYAASDVATPPAGSVEYTAYKPPPNVQRGKCVACGDAAIEQFAAPLFPKLTMVPAARHADAEALPEPLMHMFYDKRITDADDDLPKRSGFLASQLAFVRLLLKARRTSKGH